jgi:hypothetical protein
MKITPPDSVSQMMVLIKTVSKTNSPLFFLSVIYIQKSLQGNQKCIYVFNHVFFTTGNMKRKEYDNVVTSPNSYRKIVETETKVIPLHLTHILNLISVSIRQLKYC